MSAVQTILNFNNFAGNKFLLLTTFRKNGTPVPTPICPVIDGGVAYLVTMEETGKLKRIRNERRVTLAACDSRGKPNGPTYAARARLVTGNELKRSTILRETPFIGASFKPAAKAHWLVKPMQLFERIWYRHRFVAIALEPSLVVDLAVSAQQSVETTRAVLAS